MSGAVQQERHQQAVLEEHLQATGWRYFHTHNAQHSVAGFPDIVALRGSRVLVAEIKTANGRVGPEQRAWLDAFQAAGVPAYLWRLPGRLGGCQRGAAMSAACSCYHVAPGTYVRAVDCAIHLATGYRLPYLAPAASRSKRRPAEKAAA